MKTKREVPVHKIAEELFESEIALLDMAISKRTKHLKSVDELGLRDLTPKQRKTCPTKKHRYRDHKEAVKVLHSIDNSRQRAAAEGRTYHFRQVGKYLCNCNSVHLTSQKQRAQIKVEVSLVA